MIFYKEVRLNLLTAAGGATGKETALGAYAASLGLILTDYLRTAAIYFYGGREGLSVIENLGTIGVPLPGKVRESLEQLTEKGKDADVDTTTSKK